MCLNKKLNREFTHTEWEVFDFGGGRITIPTPPNKPKQESQNAPHQEMPSYLILGVVPYTP